MFAELHVTDVGCSLEEHHQFAEATHSDTVVQPSLSSHPADNSLDVASVTADTTLATDVTPTCTVSAAIPSAPGCAAS